MNYANYIDHTLLKADAGKEAIIKLCEEAKEYGFKSVCVNPTYIPLCKEKLQGSEVLICTVIGFPLGMMSTKAKVAEALDAVNMGADEVDMVINVGFLKDGNLDYVTNEIRCVKKAIGDKTLKVIVETCLLGAMDKRNACQCVLAGGADFIKTSTGFSTAGATVEDVSLFKEILGDSIKIKAAGGIRDKETFLKMIEAGADRIGASAGIALIA